MTERSEGAAEGVGVAAKRSNFVSELRRRNVIRMAGLYLVTAWLLVQIADTLLPVFDAPGWVIKTLVALMAIGFLPALVFSWVYELTPEGLKREGEIAPEQSIALHTAQKMDRLILIGLAVLIAMVAGSWWSRGSAPESVTAPATNQAEPSAVAAIKPRLAVLPLANFSPDPNNAFFADGLHDDLLTALSELQGVELVSRTTMQTFKGSTKKLAEIAQEIGATQVLEGSVRRDETKVRLTVQLIDARTDDHLWAKSFERPLAEAMSLQNEVALGVAKTMGRVLGTNADAVPPTAVPAAYDLFLKARLSTDRESRLQLLDAAILLDPGYAAARAQRALVACLQLWFDDRQAALLAPQARSDIERARQDRPGLALTEVADAVYSYYVDRDYTTALAKVGRVLEQHPNEVDAWLTRSNLARRLGRRDESVAAAERGLQLDPGNLNAVLQATDVYRYYGRYRDAIAVWNQFLMALPEDAPERGRARWELRIAVAHLTGDPKPILQRIEQGDINNQAVWDYYHELKGPSPERVARQMSNEREWVTRSEKFIAPRAVYAARDADVLGDAAALERALTKAEQLYATLPADVLARPIVAATQATIPALRGDAATARRMVEEAIAGSPPPKDVSLALLVRQEAAIVLAIIGDNAAALDVMEELFSNNGSYLFGTYLDANLRQRLGGEPRYQALIKKFEAGFEKP